MKSLQGKVRESERLPPDSQNNRVNTMDQDKHRDGPEQKSGSAEQIIDFVCLMNWIYYEEILHESEAVIMYTVYRYSLQMRLFQWERSFTV